MKIHVGSGSIYLDGYVNVDVPCDGMHLASARPDLAKLLLTTEDAYYARHEDKTLDKLRGEVMRVTGLCDVYGDFQSLPFGERTVEEVLCRQVFEHLSIHEAHRAFKEVDRVLKPGGLFRVDVPDVEETAKKLQETKDPFFIRHLFGSRKDDYGYHLMGYTRESITRLANQYGFSLDGEEPNIHFYPAFCLRFRKGGMSEWATVVHQDERGMLVAAQNPDHPVVRVFAITEVPSGKSRANHAHKKTQQTLVCVAGSFELRLEYRDGRVERRVLARGESQYIPPMTWTVVTEFAPGTVLLALCDQPYDAMDYVASYDEYQATVGIG